MGFAMRMKILGFIFAGLAWLETSAAPNMAAHLDNDNFVALAADGTVWAAAHFDGYTQYYPLCGEGYGGVADIPPGTIWQVRGLRDVVAVSGHAALKADGTVWVWQQMVYSRISDPANMLFGFNLFALPLRAEQVPGLSDVTQIADNFVLEANLSYGYALKNDGSVWRWSNQASAFDPQKPCYFRNQVVTTAEKVAGIDQVVSLKAYSSGALVLKADGSVWTLAKGSTPTRIPNLENVSAIFAGGYTAFALKADGSLFGWGDNGYCELGSTHKDLGYSATPVAIPDIGHLKQLVVGSNVAAIKQDGSVWAWGTNSGGQICPEGDGPCPSGAAGGEDYCVPVRLRGVGNDILSISAGEYNFTIVKPDGSIYIIGGTGTDYGIKPDTTLGKGGNYAFTLFPPLNLLTPPPKTDTDRILDWAEQDYAHYFAPAGIATRSALGYDFRYYPHTNSYLGTRDGRVWYLPPGVALEGIVDVGAMAERLNEASGKGF